MGKLSKTIGAPIGSPLEPELANIGANEEVRTATPEPTNDLEPNLLVDSSPYEPGKTPPYESPVESEAEAEEPKTEDEKEEEEDPDIPGPAPPAPWKTIAKSGPITPADVPEPKFLKEARIRKIVEESKKEEPKHQTKLSKEPCYETPEKSHEREPKDSRRSTPRKDRALEPKVSNKRLKSLVDPDSEALFLIRQEIINKMTHDQSLSDTDSRTLLLSLHSQVAKLTGAIENNNSSVDKLAGKVRSIHGHVAAQDEAFFKWIEKVERLITDSWRSQGRNRSSIDDYNKLLKEISKELNTKLDAIRAAEVGARFQSGIPRPEPNWMYPGHGATSSSNPQPNFTAMPTNGFAAYGYQNREPQPFYQHPHPEECAFCRGGHLSEKCKAYGKWYVRRRLMMDQNKCFVCMTPSTDGQTHEECKLKPPCVHCHTTYPSPQDLHRRQHAYALCERVKPVPMDPVKETAAPPPKKAKPTIKKETSSSTKKSSHKKYQ
ncbi:hypothetical protein CAEBREN_07164 [Caenorhabditis brenneri]|uniref:Uncharacterized protein n=1 Tax=Caenorhabditis brenneri TaxID=135651 RepID=G0N2N5_CAEBE|nr:hypothetical protein CAEBREN_07164 [Caenorhabditis brenneri]